MIGLGVGIDYALFLVSRHRSHLKEGMELHESIAATVATSGSAVVYAGGTVVIALLALAVAGIPLVTALGYASAVAVATAVLAAVTFLPALLSAVGPQDRLGPRAERPPSEAEGAGDRILGRVVPCRDAAPGPHRSRLDPAVGPRPDPVLGPAVRTGGHRRDAEVDNRAPGLRPDGRRLRSRVQRPTARRGRSRYPRDPELRVREPAEKGNGVEAAARTGAEPGDYTEGGARTAGGRAPARAGRAEAAAGVAPEPGRRPPEPVAGAVGRAGRVANAGTAARAGREAACARTADPRRPGGVDRQGGPRPRSGGSGRPPARWPRTVPASEPPRRSSPAHEPRACAGRSRPASGGSSGTATRSSRGSPPSAARSRS